ncbi:hypothetical protein [Gimesia panareensis]|uniref:hypothetical protein n=1 Tax=Gimesia panareensis TaxID=2527978 RepID=UPI00118D4BAA|nr:hypothetical protein [Gimesia panareensis]QDU50391.1 hypothetical protein Pan110_27370 [Gimesia panareensis]
MTTHRKSCPADILSLKTRVTVLRRVCVSLLCLSYVVTNTGMVASLEIKTGCQCAEDLKANSSCCCFNKHLSATESTEASCCTSSKTAGRSCCSAKKRKSSHCRKSAAASPQISRACRCGDSQHKGWYVTDPRQLNSGPRIISELNPPQALVVANDVSTSIAVQPEIPPPQRVTR